MIYVLEHLSSVTSEQMQRASLLVSQQRREYAARYRFESDRIQSIVAFLLLQYAIQKEYGIVQELQLNYSGGKPVLEGLENLHFNLSHCKLAAACALSDSPIGVDVQDWASRYLSVAKQVCTAQELCLLEQAAEPAVEFAKLWTQKESYGKFTGQGIVYPMREHSFAEQAPAGTVMGSFVFQGYALSYCAKKACTIHKVTMEDLLKARPKPNAKTHVSCKIATS